MLSHPSEPHKILCIRDVVAIIGELIIVRKSKSYAIDTHNRARGDIPYNWLLTVPIYDPMTCFFNSHQNL
jgi:hypothetical protein